MSNRKKITLLLILVLAAALTAAGCSKKPETLEEYAESNSEISEKIGEVSESSGVNIEIKGNDIIYSYDLASIEGYTEEVVKNEAAVEALSDALDKSGENFVSICKSVQEAAGISGVQAIVSYTFNDEVVVSKTFTAEGAVGEEKTEPAEGEDGQSEESETVSEDSEE